MLKGFVRKSWAPDVGVGAGLEGADVVFVARHGRNEDYGYVVEVDVLLDGARELEAVHHWHHDVADDDVRRVVEDVFEGFASVGAGCHFVFLGELVGEVGADFFVVLHDEHVRGRNGGAFFHGFVEVGHKQALGVAEGYAEAHGARAGEGVVGDVARRVVGGGFDGDGDGEACAGTVGVVGDGDCAAVKCHELIGEVQPHAGAAGAVAVGLVETVEDALFFRVGHAYAGVGHRDCAGARGGYREAHFLAGCHLCEGVAEVVDEWHERRAAEREAHLPLLDFAQVHELVDETQDALGVAQDEAVLVAAAVVGVGGEEFLQRAYHKRHGRAYLVGDVHERLQAGFVYLLGVGELKQFGAMAHAGGVAACYPPQQHQQRRGVQCFCPGCGVPGTGHEDGDGACLRLGQAVDGLELEAVFAGAEVVQVHDVGARAQRLPRLVVDGVGEEHRLGAAQFLGAEFHGEGTVVGAEAEFRGLVDGLVAEGGIAVHVQAGYAWRPGAPGGCDVARIEIGDAARAAEIHALRVRVLEYRTLVELVALQAVVEHEIGDDTAFRVEAREAEVESAPSWRMA